MTYPIGSMGMGGEFISPTLMSLEAGGDGASSILARGASLLDMGAGEAREGITSPTLESLLSRGDGGDFGGGITSPTLESLLSRGYGSDFGGGITSPTLEGLLGAGDGGDFSGGVTSPTLMALEGRGGAYGITDPSMPSGMNVSSILQNGASLLERMA